MLMRVLFCISRDDIEKVVETNKSIIPLRSIRLMSLPIMSLSIYSVFPDVAHESIIDALTLVHFLHILSN